MKVYTICVGYGGPSKKEAESYLLNLVRKYRENFHTIVTEALAYEPEHDSYTLTEAAKLYDPSAEKADIEIVYDEHDAIYLVIQSASGDSEFAEIKEALRRAFCRLIIKDMHLKKFEVNITVS